MRRSVLTLLAVALISSYPVAQLDTIPSQLARRGSLRHMVTIPSGLPPTIDQMLARTDLLVRGTVAEPRSYMTEDQRGVLTDYEIRNATILYNRHEPSTVPLPLTVTLPGGRIDVGGRSFISQHGGLPGLPSGQDVVLCLQRGAGSYLIALRYTGAFAIHDEHLVPLTREHGFAPELRRVGARDVVAAWVARAQVLHGRQ